MQAVFNDPGFWIAMGVTLLSLLVALAMHRVFKKILQQAPPESTEKPTQHA